MNIKFIGITGGSGAGKSTLCNSLLDKYPDQIGLIQLDDYFKPKDERPKVGEIVSSDHPESLYFEKLVDDLKKLSNGESVVINTKNEKFNPEYFDSKKRIPVEFFPKPVMLVEGFLVLNDESIRNMLTTSIYLDTDTETRWLRRVHFKDDEYKEKVLNPMHDMYVEPTKKFAEHIIDVSSLTKEQVLEEVEKIIFKG